MPVGGTYQPVAGDFDGDGRDELLWFGAGSAADYLWRFTSETSVDSEPVTVDPTGQPLAGDFTADGADDVLFYGRGTAADVLWENDPGGGRTATPVRISGDYRPVVGSFGGDATDDVFFYGRPAAAGDYLWDFAVGTTGHVSVSLPVSGDYEPFSLDAWRDGARGEDIYFYAPGPGTDHFWDFRDGVKISYTNPVNGWYRPVVTGDFLDAGTDDILWFTDAGRNGDRSINMWQHWPDTGGLFQSMFRFSPEAWYSATPGVPVAATSTGTIRVGD